MPEFRKGRVFVREWGYRSFSPKYPTVKLTYIRIGNWRNENFQLEMTMRGPRAIQKSLIIPSPERIRPVHFFIFKFKANFGSKLRATKNKLFFTKSC